MLITFDRNSNILRVALKNSSTGAGLTGLAYNSSGLIISTITDAEGSATAYTVAGSNIEDITTIGTYAAPTSGKCRFKAVDATNHPGLYEIHLADARFSVANATKLIVSIHGAANLLQADLVIDLTRFDHDVATQSVNVSQLSGDTTAADNAEAFFDGTGYAGTNNVIPTVTTLTNLPAITANWLTAAGIADDAITAAKIATGAIDADALAADAVDEIFDEQIGDSTITMRQALRVLIAALGGKASGLAGTSVAYRNYADTGDVIAATVDADGNRSATTLTP